MIPQQPIPAIVAGDDYPLIFEFDGDGAELALESASVRLTIKRQRGDAEALLQREIAAEPEDIAARMIRAPISDAETIAWKGFGSVFIQAQLNLAGDLRSVILQSVPVLDPA